MATQGLENSLVKEESHEGQPPDCILCMIWQSPSPGHPSTADEAWYWPKPVLHSGWLCITSRPVLIREMWFFDCSWILFNGCLPTSYPSTFSCTKDVTDLCVLVELYLYPLVMSDPGWWTMLVIEPEKEFRLWHQPHHLWKSESWSY